MIDLQKTDEILSVRVLERRTHNLRALSSASLIRMGRSNRPGSLPRGVRLNSKLADVDSLAAQALVEEPAGLGKAVVVFNRISKIAKVCKLQLSDHP